MATLARLDRAMVHTPVVWEEEEMKAEELKRVLAEHRKWTDGNGGECADLHSADLQGAELQGARLQGADLKWADLQGAELQGAELQGARLQGARLQGADLKWADLRGARLQSAELQSAELQGADLRGARLQGARLPGFQIPQHGELRVYKKAGGKIVHLKIPRWAKRTASLVGRKCRASAAIVLAIEGDKPVTSERRMTYEIGKTVYPDSYDPDIRVECSHGIHFFLTRDEAEEWEI